VLTLSCTNTLPPDNYETTHAFSDFANWLVPGSLLVGRYPYVEPSRCKSYDDGEKKLGEILRAGVTTFISLQVCEGVWCVRWLRRARLGVQCVSSIY
jgi:hypothetical protein